ncbi:MAG: hypothetical protein AAF810_11200 [Cyanobacteria bacterium P01_D01_bin.36]
MKGFKLSALFSTLILSGSTLLSASLLTHTAPAIAQDAGISPADSEYLTQLYSFLESRDPITHAMATQSMSEEDSIWAAQMFCRTFESGISPTDAFSAYTSSALEQAAARGATMTEEMAFAVGLYGGAVMNIGSAHYCPQYQPEVEQAFQAFRG